jgi:hypothetical protein
MGRTKGIIMAPFEQDDRRQLSRFEFSNSAVR